MLDCFLLLCVRVASGAWDGVAGVVTSSGCALTGFSRSRAGQGALPLEAEPLGLELLPVLAAHPVAWPLCQGQIPEEGTGGGTGGGAVPPRATEQRPHPGTPSSLAAFTSLFTFFTSKRRVWREYCPGNQCSRLTSTETPKVANLLE